MNPGSNPFQALNPRLRRALATACVFALVRWLSLAGNAADNRVPAMSPPNIVLIFCDDLGYGDLGCYGSRTIRTPHLDRLARQGTRFTGFYSSQPVCSASRASLMTGCYANRIGIHGALGPFARHGLNPEETTLAELARGKSYATAIVGKWHLGRPAPLMPLAHGFDEFLGLPYSNDMWPNNPAVKPGTYPPLPLFDGDRVIEEQPDQRFLTRRYTERSIQFIERNQRRPFLLYLAHSMPHVPLFTHPDRTGRSPHGLYADVIEEIDDSVGAILQTLDRLDLARNTWVIFTSDNGPWKLYGNHGGSSGPFRESKGTVYEGGIRVPCLMRWPGRIPSGRTVGTPWMTIDLFPTVARVLGAALPSKPIDGRDAWPLISGARPRTSPQETYFFYYNEGELQGLRHGRWKLILPHRVAGLSGLPGGQNGRKGDYVPFQAGLELYDLERDPGETRPLTRSRPEVVQQLLALAEGARAELGDRLTGRTGVGVRPPGVAELVR